MKADFGLGIWWGGALFICLWVVVLITGWLDKKLPLGPVVERIRRRLPHIRVAK